MALQGDIATVPVRELLIWLARWRATGTLSLSRGMVAWRFQLRGGCVELAASADRETMLGHLLVDRSLITPEQLQAALEEGKRTRARLGKILARQGLVSAPALADLLSAKVEAVLADAMAWTEGRFFFDDAPLPRMRPAVRTAVDLRGLLGRAGTEPLPITDADVLEVSEIAPPGWPWREQVR